MSSDSSGLDDEFFDRADAIIGLSNKQLDRAKRGVVSASTLYAASRFNAWVSATGFESGDEMRENLDEVIEYFVTQYRAMLTENVEDYVANFDAYMRAS